MGSIKRLENLINELGYDGRTITAPLVGLNELRQADAHLPSRELKNSYSLAEIDITKPFPIIGKNLIETIANQIYILANILKEKNDQNKSHSK